MRRFLSKSKIKQGFQCVKSLYLQVYQNELGRDFTDREKQLFKQGEDVQKEAQKSFPNGYSVEAPYWDFQKAFQETQQALKKYPYIYEATFMTEELVARVDVLEVQPHFFNIYEIKSSTQVKEDHILDLAIQKYILNKCGYEIKKCYLMFLNKEGTGSKYLFTIKEVSNRVSELRDSIDTRVKDLKKILSQKSTPQVDIGPYCKKPYECRFMGHCWKSVPKPSVLDIPGLGELSWELYRQNKISLKEVPTEELTSQQKMYRHVHLTHKPYINKDRIIKELSKWKTPLYYLDFETFSSPIPYLEGTSPYQDIPFQFHCLKQNSITSSFEEGFYLHSNREDPREFLIKKLVSFIQKEGSVVAYYKDFESKQLKMLAKCFPKFKNELLEIESKLEDPLPLLRQAVYFEEFNASWSLKKVAPALIGKKGSYLDLEVQDGLEAQRIFKKMMGLKSEDPQKDVLRKNLIRYCRQDTVCLAKIVKWLWNQVSSELQFLA